MILVCGEALVDLFVDGAAPLHSAELPARAVAGGSPFNVAVGLARLGARPGFFGGISTDRFGAFLLERLQAEGVDTGCVKRSAAPTPLVVVATGADGSPAYTFHAQHCAYGDVMLADLPAQPTALALGSFSLTVEPVGSTLLALAEREAGRIAISLDPNVRPVFIDDLPAWHRRFARFAAVATIIKLSTEDLHTAWGAGQADTQAAAWLAGGAELVVITDGADGATAYHASGKIAAPGRLVDVVDTVGAGDTFHAALLARLAELGRLRPGGLADIPQPALQDLLDYAVLAASITCTRRGANLPTRAELAATPGTP